MNKLIPLLGLALLLLTACSGEDSTPEAEDDGSAPVNTAPSVEAGPNQNVTEGDTVQLAAVVTDTENDAMLTWSQVSGPDVSLSSTSAADATFVAPEVSQTEDVVLRATVDDGFNDPSSDDVVITIEDSSPKVDAGYGRIVVGGSTVSLNASVTGFSSTPSLTWNQLEGPTVTLSSTTTEDPSFTAPSVSSSTTLVFEFTASPDGGDSITDQVSVEIWVGADSSSDLTVLGDFSAEADWACTADPVATPRVAFSEGTTFLTIESNGIPDHSTGTYPNSGNPNIPSEQEKSFEIDLFPADSGSTTTMMQFGVTLDGVKLERDTNESWQNAGQWNYEAITAGLADVRTDGAEWTWLGTDCNNGHVQPTGEYHYHGLMEGIINRLGEKTNGVDQMVLGGYAADGFPFYIRYGHSDPNDATSPLVRLTGSYEVINGTRPSGPGGAYDGTFRQDWEYVDGSGDLDECNGRFGVTPEHPEGIYHYYMTDDYPFIPSCVRGTPSSSFRTLGGGGGPGGG